MLQFQKVGSSSGESVIGQICLVAEDDRSDLPLERRLEKEAMTVGGFLILALADTIFVQEA